MLNPTLQEVTVGDVFIYAMKLPDGRDCPCPAYVLKIQDVSMRFGKEDRLLTVCVRTGESGKPAFEPVRDCWHGDLVKGVK